MKYTAHYETIASATITLDVPDDVAAGGAEAIQEWIWTHAPERVGICAKCSGWGQDAVSLELGEFEPTDHGKGPLEGLAYVTDADGNAVTE